MYTLDQYKEILSKYQGRKLSKKEKKELRKQTEPFHHILDMRFGL